MGLAWQQGPLGTRSVGHFLTEQPLPERVLFAERAAWQYTNPPSYADILRNRVAFAWRSMDAFYEEDERIVGHAADPYHRNDIRQTSRHLVRDGDASSPRHFCPYKGLASYYDIGTRERAAWSYLEAWPEVGRVSGYVSFEPDIVDVYLDGDKQALERGQTVTPHGIGRGLDPNELAE